MRQLVTVCAAFAFVGLMACPALAQHYSYHPVHAFERQWHLNCMWPEPFLSRDRMAVRAPFATMIEKGWQVQNTLGDYHFDAETQQLTRAGELHLRWIVTQAPEHRRTVFVLRGHNEAATAVRLDTVQQSIAQIQPRGALPAVVQTSVAPPAAPADYADDITQKAIQARPAPVLPANMGVGGGVGGGAGGGAGL